jgi:hypothetical protein
VGEKLGLRAVNIYSAVAVTYTALKYSAAVGDALRLIWRILVIILARYQKLTQ